MTDSTRRKFLKTTTMAMGLAFAGTQLNFIKYEPLLSFSTLGCPDWSFAKILEFAAENNYNGVEIRGILRQLDLTKCPEFNTPQNIAATRKLIEEKSLQVVDLGSSAELHHADPAQRKKFLDEGRRFIDLAHALNCPYIRVFPNDFPKEQERDATVDLIIKGLLELGEYAGNTGVSVLMESHGEVVHTEDLKRIMQGAQHPHVGLVWDVANMWTVTKEPPGQVYTQLKNYIRHTHIKDANLVNGNPQYTLLGRGEVPIFEAIDVLAKANYKGYYSFEWEKLWHPEIAEPEVALADYPKAMRQHFTF